MGTPVVEGCVKHGSHYVDITGETPWARRVIDQHHATAAAKGTRIIPFCGFDSVPSDIGALACVEHLERTRGTGTRAVRAASMSLPSGARLPGAQRNSPGRPGTRYNRSSRWIDRVPLSPVTTVPSSR